uniref:Prolyl 4-hydroxylase alpha subunit domain-containing protein n=2 Tax=Photinus pyralis TaxID=7054 RepID=A0A1Y1MRR5_PHOPY
MDIPGNSSEHPDSEDDCVIISNLLTKSTIRGYHYPKLTKEQYVTPEPPTKLMKPSLAIRNDLTTTAFLDFFHQNYVNSEYAVNDNVEIVKEPFKVCVVHNFLDDEAVLLKIQDEFNEIEWNKRSLDLYEFFQSKDLKDVHSYYVSCMYEFLKNDVKDWIQNLTGMEFVNISATCSLYTHTDYLLVHDDLQGSRAIAFVLYFSGPASWKTESGGALQLFEMDFVGEPSDVVRSIYPRNNQFVFFPVSTNSYHQVGKGFKFVV